MQYLKNSYQKLYHDTNIASGYRFHNKQVGFNELSHFTGMKGKEYDQQEVKLLLIGRAVNGWGSFNADNAETFSQLAIEKLENNAFNWIVYDNGALRNDSKDEKGNYYFLDQSAFWRTARKIWEKLSDNVNFKNTETNKWTDRIAWTNLYKIAPLVTGNPTGTMCKKQLDACKEILKAEIEIFHPTHILFVTGYQWWFEDFKDVIDAEFSQIKKNEYRSNLKNNIFAETHAVMQNGTKIVVACRPEGRDETAYVDHIVETFRL